MRIHRLRCFVLCLLANVAVGTAHSDESNAESPRPIRLRILTYNIHHAEGTDGKLDVGRIADVIRRAHPDVVAVQEVDQGVERSQKFAEADELGRLLEMNVAFGPNIDLGSGKYGNAVLSKFPIRNRSHHKLPKFDVSEQRGVLDVTIEVEPAKSIRFLATHFDHRRPDSERQASADAINQLVVEQSAQPTILAGDINDTPASRTIQKLEASWKRVPLENELPRQIDHVFVRPAADWKIVEGKVLDEPVASDHLPVLVVLELRSEQ